MPPAGDEMKSVIIRSGNAYLPCKCMANREQETLHRVVPNVLSQISDRRVRYAGEGRKGAAIEFNLLSKVRLREYE